MYDPPVPPEWASAGIRSLCFNRTVRDATQMVQRTLYPSVREEGFENQGDDTSHLNAQHPLNNG